MAQSESTSQLIDRIEPLIDNGEAGELSQAVLELDLDDSVLLTSRLSSERQVRLLELLPADMAADIIHGLPFASATEIVEEMAVHRRPNCSRNFPLASRPILSVKWLQNKPLRFLRLMRSERRIESSLWWATTMR